MLSLLAENFNMNKRVENTENFLQQKYLIPTENLHIIITLNPHSRKQIL